MLPPVPEQEHQGPLPDDAGRIVRIDEEDAESAKVRLEI